MKSYVPCIVLNAYALILGSRYSDGVVLAADTKFITKYDAGTRCRYGTKITGGLDGISAGFSGDRGVFEVFTMTLMDYVTSTHPDFQHVKLRISQIQNEF
jgi:hypothetical protein